MDKKLTVTLKGNVLVASDGARESFSIKVNSEYPTQSDVGHAHRFVCWLVHKLAKGGVTVEGLIRVAITEKLSKVHRAMLADEIVQSADVPHTPGWQERVLNELNSMVIDGAVLTQPTIPVSYILKRE